MAHPDQSALLAAALSAAGRGWPVIPLHPGSKVPALHGERTCSRTGDCAHGHRTFERRATTDPARIERCWAAGPFNVGIATGPAGLLVVDLDTVKATDEKGTPDGATNFSALCERAGKPVPATRTIRTARGGRHLYFAVPAGVRLGNTAGTLAPRVDTRAWGGQVVAPGSRVPQGPYTVLCDAPVAKLPKWLQSALTAPQRPATTPIRPTAPRDAPRLAAVVFEREVSAVAATGEGGRNAELLRAVRAVGRFVAWGDLDRTAVEEAFQAGGESAGLPASECRTTIRSALDYAIRTARPRQAAS
ncbi:bifunctional DNA primase/polymerase [Streptomyces sp. V4-01]|uniref:Bifunctional DNA primase/polymerase n=1 Tax=Actinacidiphila polyblastidii TaxID=3110430 RepID=A0ABU7PEF4_9ACTN|nr:bifunctional DNA primase/polymerase [Streptomyces sp. V4-01]